MKNVKRRLAILVSIIIVFLIAMIPNYSVQASQKDNLHQPKAKNEKWVIRKDNNGDEYLLEKNSGAKISKSYGYDEEGNLVELSLNERLDMLNSITIEEIDATLDDKSAYIESNISKSQVRSPLTYTQYRYSKTSSSTVMGSVVKVTPSIGMGGTASYGESVTVTNQYSGSATISAEIRNKMTATAGFEWTYSAQTSKSFSMTFTNNKWPKAYIGFSPKLKKVWGPAYRDTYNTVGTRIKTESLGTAYGYSPVKLSNGFVDGVFDMYQDF